MSEKIDLNPYETEVRNRTIEEIARAIEQFKAFGPNTLASFAVFIRSMKRE
jgi:hypothetical protein